MVEETKKESKLAFLMPSKITSWGFTTILIVVIIISIIHFPLGKVFNPNFNPNSDEIVFGIGWPVNFFELSFTDTSQMPIKIPNLLLCLLIYFVIAYVIDLILSALWRLLKKPFQKKKLEETEPAKEQKPTENNNEEVYKQARIYFDYCKKQGVSEENIIELFKQKSWKDEDIRKVLDLKTTNGQSSS